MSWTILAMLALAVPASAQTQTRARDASGSLAEAPIQGQHVRTMIVSCKPDETVKFYRDVLGMKVLSDDGGKPV
jgi:hypothetical protein